LKNSAKISIVDFFVDLAKLSYQGDIRTYLKAEKKDKINNVVLGALDLYLQIYQPMLDSYNVKKNGDYFIFDKKFNQDHYEKLPDLFKINLQLYMNNYSSKEEFENIFINKLTHEDRRFIIDSYLKRLNFYFSTYGIMSGLYSTNFSKSVIKLNNKLNLGCLCVREV
jgi:hypothetical protein